MKNIYIYLSENEMNKKILMSIVAVLLCITIGASVGNFIGDSVKVNADIVVSPHESDVFFEESVSESESESTSESESVSDSESTSESESESESEGESESVPEEESKPEESDLPAEDEGAFENTEDNGEASVNSGSENSESMPASNETIGETEKEEAEYTVIGNIAIKKNAIADEMYMWGIIFIAAGVVGLILIIIWAVKSKNKKLDPEKELLKTVSEAGKKNKEAAKKAPERKPSRAASASAAAAAKRPASRSSAQSEPRTSAPQSTAPRRTAVQSTAAAGARTGRASAPSPKPAQTPRATAPNSEAYRSAKAAASAEAAMKAKKASKFDTQDLLDEFLKK